jgi:hypothetical protein
MGCGVGDPPNAKTIKKKKNFKKKVLQKCMVLPQGIIHFNKKTIGRPYEAHGRR